MLREKFDDACHEARSIPQQNMGKRHILLFCSTIALAQWSEFEISNIIAGFAMLAVGVVNFIVGAIVFRSSLELGRIDMKVAMQYFDSAIMTTWLSTLQSWPKSSPGLTFS